MVPTANKVHNGIVSRSQRRRKYLDGTTLEVQSLLGLLDCDGRAARAGFKAGLFQLEPDGVAAGLDVLGQRVAVFAILRGRVGHLDVRRGDLQINRVRSAVVDAAVTLDSVGDFIRVLQNLHNCGTCRGRMVRPLDLVVDGVGAGLGEAGDFVRVFAVHGGRIAHRCVRRGDVHRD